MKGTKIQCVAHNLRKNCFVLLSAVSSLCLFLSPSLLSVGMLIAMLVVVIVASMKDVVIPPAFSCHTMQMAAALLALQIALEGYSSFKTTWATSRKVAALAVELHLSVSTLLLAVGLGGCIVGFYASYVLASWLVTWALQLFKEILPQLQKTEVIVNLKRNWYYPIFALAFLCLYMILTPSYFIWMFFVFLASFIIAAYIPSLPAFMKKTHVGIHAVSFLTALGICWRGQYSFYAIWSTSSKVKALETLLPIQIDIVRVISVLGIVLGSFFVYYLLLVFWNKMTEIFAESNLWKDIHRPELFIYGTIMIASCVIVILTFTQTEVFYGGEYAADIIYTSDSPFLVKGEVYLNLTHPENDLRQPLFAVFAAPFAGIPYLIGKLFHASDTVQAILINISQVILLCASNLMLARMMKLNTVRRVCFMLLTSCTYTHMLFTLMMEQYIVAYFWLVFCLYLIAQRGRPNRMALWGAGGTMLTSMILLPFMSKESPLRDFKGWIADMLKFGMEFVLVILAFYRYDVICNISAKISALSGYTGQSLSLMDKIYQYTAFIRNYFLAPDAGINATAVNHISWQLNPATGINAVGTAILLFAICSTILNREKMSSRLAAGWAGYSVLMLLVLGWGTQENGLVLYSLYFGWAFFVLLFQLAEQIENWLRVSFLIPILSVGCMFVLAAVNVPKMMELVDFALTYFPA